MEKRVGSEIIAKSHMDVCGRGALNPECVFFCAQVSLYFTDYVNIPHCCCPAKYFYILWESFGSGKCNCNLLFPHQSFFYATFGLPLAVDTSTKLAPCTFFFVKHLKVVQILDVPIDEDLNFIFMGLLQ